MAIVILALLVVSSQPATAPPSQSKPKLACRGGEIQLGSHVHAPRRCLTDEQWQEEDARRDRVPVTLRVTAGQGDSAQPTRRPQ
ncbi:MAG TPA: hypothetical protein VE820_09900 [Sphingomicrobium sp.]|jgi:hypothetical protein|nr:hypothetical protein [Sphingomicrobium sp.]